MGGLSDFDEHRRRTFREETARLLFDVQRFQPQADRILGQPFLSQMFIQWMPDLARQLTMPLPSPVRVA